MGIFERFSSKKVREDNKIGIQEAGFGLVRDPTQRLQGHAIDEPGIRKKDDLKYFRNAYNNVPLIAGIVNTKTDQVVQDFYFQGPNKATLEKFSDKVNLKTIFHRICKLACIYGDSFCEVLLSRAGKVEGLKVLNSEWMRRYTDDYGEIIGYGQIINDKKMALFGTTGDAREDANFKKRVKRKDLIVHFKFNSLESGNYGTSMIRPMLPLIDTKLDMEDDLKLLVRRYIAPIIHAQVGSDNLSADESDISDVASSLEDIRSDNEIVTSHLVKLSVLDFNKKGVDIKTPFEHIDKQILSAGQVPPSLLGISTGVDRATAEVQLRNFWGHVKAVQRWLKVDFEDQVIVRFKLGGMNDKLIWKHADPREKDVDYTILRDFVNTGMLTPQKANKILPPEFQEKLPEVSMPEKKDENEERISQSENPNDPTQSTRIKKGMRVTKTDFRSPLDKTEPK